MNLNIKDKVKVKVPGKLYLAGEYAVVEPLSPAIAFAVDAFIEITVETSKNNEIYNAATNSNYKWFFSADNKIVVTNDKNKNLELTAESINVSLNYIKEKYNLNLSDAHFKIRINSDLENSEGKKYGYGSSGAATVAACQAILKLFSIDEYLSPIEFAELTFKLSAIAQTRLGKLGSFGDLATSSLGGLVFYQNFDRAILNNKYINNLQNFTNIIDNKWPGLILKPLQLPEDWTISIMWSKNISSTESLLKQAPAKINQKLKNNFLESSKEEIEIIINALTMADWKSFKKAITNNYNNIKHYLQMQNRPYTLKDFEIAEKSIKNLDACFKISGAGAGDCAIAISPNSDIANKLIKTWENNNLAILKHKLWKY